MPLCSTIPLDDSSPEVLKELPNMSLIDIARLAVPDAPVICDSDPLTTSVSA